MKKALSTAALITLLALTGCSQTGATSTASEPTTETTTEAADVETTEAAPETSEPEPEVTTSAPEPSATEDATEATEGAIDFGQTWTYEDGVEVTVTPVGPGTAGDTGFGAEGTNGEYWMFDIVMTNGSEAIFDPTMFYESVQYGAAGNQAESVFDSANVELGSSGSFEGKILPGKAQTIRVAYAIPHTETGDVTMVVTPSFDHIDAIYTGSF